MGFLRNPQQVWFRKANFQIHLWSGIILVLYVVIIGVTGSILVFGAELDSLEHPNPWPGLAVSSATTDAATVIGRLRIRYPNAHIVSVAAPQQRQPVFIAVLQGGRRFTVACHPITGEVLGEVPASKSRLSWIYDLHENLLARRTGRVINGCCAAALLLVTLSGLINWWPGTPRWRQALMVDFRRSWRRINFDLHRAAGFWVACLLAIWAVTGVYFAWPEKVLAVVDRASPVVNSRTPAITVDANAEMQRIDFRAMLSYARSLEPGGEFKAILFPASRRSAFEVLISRSPGVGRDYEDTLYFNPYNGRYISTWRYGVNKSLGDWYIWLQMPLHFGTHWGLGVKCVWAAAGLALPLLAISGLLMYWNRFLGAKWKRLKRGSV